MCKEVPVELVVQKFLFHQKHKPGKKIANCQEVLSPNFKDVNENQLRLDLLNKLEGELAKLVIEREWYESTLTEELLIQLKLVPVKTWYDLSGGSFLARDASKNILMNQFPKTPLRIKQAERLRKMSKDHHQLPSELIIAEDLEYTVLDGCSRAVALNLARLNRKQLDPRCAYFGNVNTIKSL